MMSNVCLSSMLPAKAHLTILNTASQQTSVLCVPLGMLVVAGQVLGPERSATLAEKDGFEIVYTAGHGETRIDVSRRTALGAQLVASMSVLGVLLRPEHHDSLFRVTGLAALGSHILSRRHAFVAQRIRPLAPPLCSDAAAVQSVLH